MKKIVLIVIFAASMGLDGADFVKSKNIESTLIECESEEDQIKGCVERFYLESGLDSGKLGFEVPYKNGRENGVVKVYYENGNLWVEAPVKDDKVEGVAKWYRKDGSLHFSIAYENDKAKSGECGDGKTIDSKNLSEFDWQDTSVLGCD